MRAALTPAARSRRRLLVLATVLAAAPALLIPPSAAEARTVLPAGQIAAGPVLAGEDVVWGVRGRDGSVTLRAARAREVRTLTRLGGSEDGFAVRLAGSPFGVLVSEEPVIGGPYAAGGRPVQSLLLVRPDGAPEHLGGCPTDPVAFDIDGDVMAFRRCPDGGAAELVVRDGRTGAERVFPQGGGARLAGRFLATGRDGAIVVVDHTTGEEVYRALPRDVGAFAVLDLDLDAQGGLVVEYVTEQVGPSRLAVASAAAPRLRALPVPASRSLFARAVDGHVVYVRGTSSTTARVEEVTPAGQRRVLEPDAAEILDGGLDVAGGRRASLRSTCRGLQIVVDEAFRAVGRGGACRLLLARAPRLRAGGRVTASLDCTSFAGGRCRGAARLAVPGRRGRVVGRGTVRGRGSVSVRLDRATAARLRSRGRMRLVLRASLVDTAGRRSRGSRRVVVRAR